MRAFRPRSTLPPRPNAATPSLQSFSVEGRAMIDPLSLGDYGPISAAAAAKTAAVIDVGVEAEGK